NLGPSGPFTSAFGAHYLPDVIVGMLGMLHPGFSLRLVRLAIFAALFLAMAGWFFRMVRWRNLRSPLTRLPASEKMFLVIGAALIGGCFSEFISSSRCQVSLPWRAWRVTCACGEWRCRDACLS